ncbi:heterokaryon incompatibility protein-domain-containing protein [Hypomontagnella submonticulosa]|nr:heterokaryon incompatibility protein-domain-containing protein [Hypomontagnella submonticulosa]
MRLINASTCRLEDHPSPSYNEGSNSQTSTPPYAILSHTWGAAHEEVNFQDFLYSPDRGQSKPGFTKIRYSCEQALRDGLRYVWVDTCCIDKSSSAELSEAINSMYAWYLHSAVCYVYLADVSRVSFNGADDPQFRRSRWYSRGWTLQELLAPKRMQFYSSQWLPFGSKEDLAITISEITGIDAAFITGEKDIMEASVAQRMSWAANRQTTRTEDVAYCLLGLFDVNIPLIYGEGRKAFIRLQEEIIRKSEDQSIFAWTPDGNISQDIGIGALAESPGWFRTSGDIVPCDIGDAWDPPSVTSRGIHIQAPRWHVKTSTEGAGLRHVLLKCRRQDDLFGVLGLPVRVVQHNNAMYARDSQRRLATIEHSRWRDKLKNSSAPEKIYLVDPSNIRSINSNQRECGFVIRRLPGNYGGYGVSIAQPSELWAKKEGFFSTDGGRYQEPIYAVLIPKKLGANCLILRMRLHKANPDDQWSFLPRCAITLAPSGGSVGRLEIHGKEDWYELMPLGYHSMGVSVEEQLLFGSRMFVVDIEESFGWRVTKAAT